MDLRITNSSDGNRHGLHMNGALPLAKTGSIGSRHASPGPLNGQSAGTEADAWLRQVVEDFRQDAVVYQDASNRRLVRPRMAGEQVDELASADGLEVVGLLPGFYPEWLGSPQLARECGSRFSYVVGEMARGIAGVKMTIAAVESGFIGFYGSAGLRVDTVRDAVRTIREAVGADAPWGANLIHSPDRLEVETALVDLFLEEGVRNVSASAFMGLSRDIVRFSAKGLSRGADGIVERRTRVFAKISRPEVAAHFLAPPPSSMLSGLVADGAISEEQAALQSALSVAEFVTIEADSGGHTDGRPLNSLLPVIAVLRDRLVAEHSFKRPIYLGAAGGIGTPVAAASAFAMGADYVVTGSINQSAVESGLSEDGRQMLCQAGIADMAIAPAADMFEIGAKVQVLKRGTMFAAKGQRLLEIYRRHESIGKLSDKDRQWLETQVLRETFAAAWKETSDYHRQRKPDLIARAEADDHLKMALVFKRYLFLGSQWARDGHSERRIDYQIWCGPAMGAFNDWVAGSFLEAAENRTVGQIGLNILEGAAQIMRAQHLRAIGVGVPAAAFAVTPTELLLD